MWISRLFVLTLVTIPLILLVGLLQQLKPSIATKRAFVALVLLFAVLLVTSVAGYVLAG